MKKILSVLSTILATVAVIASLGLFGYKFFNNVIGFDNAPGNSKGSSSQFYLDDSPIFQPEGALLVGFISPEKKVDELDALMNISLNGGIMTELQVMKWVATLEKLIESGNHLPFSMGEFEYYGGPITFDKENFIITFDDAQYRINDEFNLFDKIFTQSNTWSYPSLNKTMLSPFFKPDSAYYVTWYLVVLNEQEGKMIQVDKERYTWSDQLNSDKSDNDTFVHDVIVEDTKQPVAPPFYLDESPISQPERALLLSFISSEEELNELEVFMDRDLNGATMSESQLIEWFDDLGQIIENMNHLPLVVSDFEYYGGSIKFDKKNFTISINDTRYPVVDEFNLFEQVFTASNTWSYPSFQEISSFFKSDTAYYVTWYLVILNEQQMKNIQVGKERYTWIYPEDSTSKESKRSAWTERILEHM